jgi:hypothetical protein
LWGLATHGLLRLTGPTAGTLNQTFLALGYAGGAHVAAAVPCLGPYLGWIWWVVSAVLMVRVRQAVSGGRAAFAVLVPPCLGIGLLVAGYVAFIVSVAYGPMKTAMAAAAHLETLTIGTSLQSYAMTHNGNGPDHALELVATRGIDAYELITADSDTILEDIPAGNGTLEDLYTASTPEIRDVAQSAADAMPDGVVAHRLGDFVFTYHGIDLRACDPQLWILIQSDDPEAMIPPFASGPTGLIAVFTAGANVIEFPSGELPEVLAKQNTLRAQFGLPPLPAPHTVLHNQPAVAPPPNAP